MADRELKRLSRRELLEMLIAQSRENERLQAEIAQLEEQLHEREIHLAQSGNIAEAALRLNGVFEAAQRAAEQYLENIGRGEITKVLIGETGDFVLIDGKTNTLRPGQEEDDADASDRDSAEAENTPGKRKQSKATRQMKKPLLRKFRFPFPGLIAKLKALLAQLRRKK